MPDNVSGAVCTVENKATLFPAAGAPGSLIHTALACAHTWKLPTGQDQRPRMSTGGNVCPQQPPARAGPENTGSHVPEGAALGQCS